MLPNLPNHSDAILQAAWAEIQPYYEELEKYPLEAGNVEMWLKGWSRLSALLYEGLQRLSVATTLNTADEAADEALRKYLDEIYPQAQAAEQGLKQKLLASGLSAAGFEVPLRNMRAEADLFRAENLPLQTEEIKLGVQYDKIIGAQTVEWEGQELTVMQLQPIYQNPDRKVREAARRKALARQLADREKINALWVKLMGLRRQMAANAGRPDYLTYRWQQLKRFDYTPADSQRFHQAIEKVVVPAARRIYEKHRQELGVETMRPWDLSWDLYVDGKGRPPLRPFKDLEKLETTASTVFHQVDPQLGEYFDTLRREGLLDLGNRKNKGPGAYCTEYPVMRRPFVFANAVGLHKDVQTTFHESGHAFHVFESIHLPYFQQTFVSMEFAEVASMGMELLASPYLTASKGGFYTEKDAARALYEHLESLILFWPYAAVVDSFQHWVYANHQAATDPANCDAQWVQLWRRFMRGEDWRGLENEEMTGWHRKLHILQSPLYYIEYAMAQLGAVQVWANSLKDQAGAVAAYRHALSLGGTRPLPELYAAAGARFVFDESTLQPAVDLIETTMAKLEPIAE